jgi:hypothetical protein
MLPASYQMPAAAVLLAGGIVACFFGYRLFRIVLAIFGFILGALVSSSIFGMSDTWPMIAAAVGGGLVGAAILIAAYFVGVALVGAGLGALVAHLAFAAGDRDPHYLAVIFLAIAGATAATYLQRYFVIVGTGFGGAWTMIVGIMAVIGNQAALAAAASGDVWVAYPMNPAPGQQWVPITWIALGAIGTGVQLGITGGEKGRVVRRGSVGRRRKKT